MIIWPVQTYRRLLMRMRYAMHLMRKASVPMKRLGTLFIQSYGALWRYDIGESDASDNMKDTGRGL